MPPNLSSLQSTETLQSRMKTVTLLAVAFASVSCSALSSKISLVYATYQGTAGFDGITRFLGMQYAAPLVGDLRWKAPQDPAQTTAVQSAAKVSSYAILEPDSHAESCTVQGRLQWSQADSRNWSHWRVQLRRRLSLHQRHHTI